MLDGAEHELRAFALAVLDAAVRAMSVTPAQGMPASLRRHGVLDDALRREVRAKALESLVIPCVAALRDRFGVRPIGAQA
jgi:hypothetical protein